MQQVIVDFGTREIFGLGIPLRVYGYGLMLVLGFLVAIYLAQWRARRGGENPENMAHVGLLALVGGIVGSRAAYIIEKWDQQFADLANPVGAMFDVTSGGLIYYGGVVLAVALVLLYLRVKRLPARRCLDMVAVSMMVGLAFGRAGCLLNGCCYGAQCQPDWSLGASFPLFSQPLLKFDGRDNPYSVDTKGPSPVYAHQLNKARISPPEALVNQADRGKILSDRQFHAHRAVHAPRFLHGALTNDQTAMWADPNTIGVMQMAFGAAAGSDGQLDAAEWERALAAGDGLLRGSEHWDEAIYSDRNRNGRLSFEEASHYLAERRTRFDVDVDGRLSQAERRAANEVLQTDQLALAAATHSLPVKPAQLLGLINALVLTGLLSLFYRLRSREGQVFALMLILYPITRFVLEIVRDDNAHDITAGVFTHNQYTSMALTTIGIVVWLSLRYLSASASRAQTPRRAAIAAAGRRKRK